MNNEVLVDILKIFIMGGVVITVIMAGCLWNAILKKWKPVLVSLGLFLLACYVVGGGRFKELRDWWVNGDKENSVITVTETVTPTPESTPEPSSQVLTGPGSDIVNFALQYVGNSYVWGGNSLTEGIDCSHFVWQVLLRTKHYNGEYLEAKYWAREGQKVSQDNIQAGDIVIYGVGPDDPGHGHIAIYDGQGLIIEAKGSAYGITHDRTLDHGDRIIAIRRFPKLETS